MKRQSIKSTYDSSKEGLQYEISSSVNNKAIGDKRLLADPFVRHTVHVSFWDTFKALFKGGITVEVFLSGTNRRIEEDVMELDDQYLGINSTRKDEFIKKINNALKDVGVSSN